MGDWKYLPYGGFPDRDDDNTPLLFNLKEDISETKNVCRQHPEIVKKLTAEIEKYNWQMNINND
jgi:hypothetical protein